MSSPDLAIIGVFPPPFGGVANHVQRLLPLLHARGIKVRVYNAVSESAAPPEVVSVVRWRRVWLPFFLFTCAEPAILMLSDRPFAWAMAAFACRVRGRRLALRLRNSRLIDVMAVGGIRARLVRYALRRMDLVICVNRELAQEVHSLGVAEQAILHAPGFLPPSERCVARSSVAENVWRFAKGADPLLVANGKISWYKGADLYGLDQLTQLIGLLVKDFPRIKLVVCFWDYQDGDASRLRELHDMAEAEGAAKAIMLNTERGTMLPILAQADLFVRPTITDGDANSIREALALGIPTIASDVVERPSGCITFRNRDLADLERVVRNTLDENRSERGRKDLQISDDVMQTIEKYVDALSGLAGSGRRTHHDNDR